MVVLFIAVGISIKYISVAYRWKGGGNALCLIHVLAVYSQVGFVILNLSIWSCGLLIMMSLNVMSLMFMMSLSAMSQSAVSLSSGVASADITGTFTKLTLQSNPLKSCSHHVGC